MCVFLPIDQIDWADVSVVWRQVGLGPYPGLLDFSFWKPEIIVGRPLDQGLTVQEAGSVKHEVMLH